MKENKGTIKSGANAVWVGDVIFDDSENAIGLGELLEIGIAAKLGYSKEETERLANEFMTECALDKTLLFNFRSIVHDLMNDAGLFEILGDELIQASAIAEYLDARFNQTVEGPLLIQTLIEIHKEKGSL